MSSGGFIKLYRDTQDHPLWHKKPFDQARAWIDLLFEAAFTDTTTLRGNQIIDVPRGSMITSLKELSQKWGWSIMKTRIYIDLLQHEKMIDVKTTNKYTRIEIVNNSIYQDNQQTKQQSNNKQITNKQQTTRVNIIKEEEELKEEKKEEIYKEEIPYREIIEFLNQKVGTQYKPTTESYKALIRARWNQGYKLQDFQKVIMNKANDWMGTDQAKYLRPETLFGTKFDSYLNQLITPKIQPSQFDNQEEMRVYKYAGVK